ncbi:deleted in malignant brain tumors 1 protein-like [Pecten maximus]|uniref:deleted in malignant brain tumors 1 protein-like n=1 Tax=Pecten maximus TaxID=6579 RepID=UPI001458C06C|nr:deleted in malignant brain tumors 1 protein-like [Pecten maximus]XP_033750732.1 deleted in malignant brain tumors 1 protein-like [Pecten maximus]
MPMLADDRTKPSFVLKLYIVSVLITTVSSQTCSVADPNVFPSTSEITVFSSPGYSAGTGNYSPDIDCFWLIDAGAADLKLLIFMTYDTSCPGDKIYIFDGNSTSDTALANGVCGTPSAPTPYSTTQRYAYVRMVSDSAIEKAGFQIDVIAAKDSSGTGCTATQSITATSSYQMLTSPNFPDKYPSNSNCRWALTSPDGYLEIDVIVSDVEDDDPASCDYDKYLLYDGANKCDNNNIQMICSEYPKVTSYSTNSTEPTVTVTLESDGSVNRRGFLLRFRSVSTPTTTTPTTTTVTATAATTAFIAAVSSTTARTTSGQLLEMNMELLVGIVFGSLLLISFTIVTVVVVVKKVSIPLEKTITPVQPYRPRPEVQPRARRSNGSTQRQSLPNGHKTQATGIGTTRTITAW